MSDNFKKQAEELRESAKELNQVCMQAFEPVQAAIKGPSA